MQKHCFFLFSLLLCLTLQSNAQKLPSIGVCNSYKNDSLFAKAGYAYIEDGVSRLLAPTVNEQQFASQAGELQRTHCRVQSCNGFIPGTIKIVGPQVDEARVLGYVDTVMHRARQAGIELIVLGSGEARKIPEGVDHAQVKAQFIVLCRKMAEVAARYGRIIAMENLNSTETNFINTLEEANEVVNAIHHPNFKLTADIYHMLKENEPAAAIEKAGKNLVHCHIAEREKRAAPGVAGQDFRPYFAALHKIGFSGRIMVECRWDDVATQSKPVYDYLKGQLEEAYKN
ncbi:sugar phosphate isomerase/epimerase family protein [uncultured Chitinophaga sp.]|jgi:Sugar phosphate isomerases/epimerases|uniref:sugar phosphate isomerase/epimerase family protein n=1 Tax=uncultured Chitinophaga sp. TaxID=339340 RepID=UPI002626BFD3|nr:sugar phosphate isomerase/epimerase family protein [uncultured Chitinophaga sp.]